MPNKIFKMSEFEQKDMFCIEHNFFDQKVDNLKVKFGRILPLKFRIWSN